MLEALTKIRELIEQNKVLEKRNEELKNSLILISIKSPNFQRLIHRTFWLNRKLKASFLILSEVQSACIRLR
jgi:hypothetical protein